MFRRKYYKYITFTVQYKKEVTRIDKNGKEIKKPYFIDYNFLIPQDLWQTHLVNTFAEGIHKVRC